MLFVNGITGLETAVLTAGLCVTVKFLPLTLKKTFPDPFTLKRAVVVVVTSYSAAK